MRRTLTWDRGSEIAKHAGVIQRRGRRSTLAAAFGTQPGNYSIDFTGAFWVGNVWG